MAEIDQLTTNPVIELALERFRLAAEADNEWREKSLDDLEFSTGEQWPLDAVNIRRGKPCLTMDQIQQSIRLVCNQYRQQPPAITVDPVGNGADTKTAEIYQGTIRHIEVNCDAQVGYEQTHEDVVRTGFGSLRVLTEYEDEDSDDQEIIIEKIRNQFSVYWQPGVPQEKAQWCFIVVDTPIDTYRTEEPDSILSKMQPGSSVYTSIGNAAPSWCTKDYIRKAEYFTIEEEEREGKRPKKKVVWRKINAVEELDKRELPGSSIPVFTAYGDDLDVNGKRYVAGLVRNAKDPQRMYNYQCSAATEATALAPKAPWVAVEGSLSGREKQWEDGNTMVLQYKQVDIAGKPAPPPTRNTVEPPIQALMLMVNQARGDLKAAMGLYDPSLGQRKSDESGIAIGKLQQQGDIATMNYADNMSRMMKRLGRVLLEWIPYYYKPAKVRRIINPDGTVKQVITHVDQDEEAETLAEQEDIKNIYNLGVGKYDVVISIGPTYQSRRQQAVSTQMDLLQHMPPQMVPMFIDLIVRNMDIPQSAEFADRAKKLLPPQLQEGEEGDPETQISQLQSKLSQLGQQHQQLAQALEHSNQIIQTKQVEQQGKVQMEQVKAMSQQEIVKMQEATKLAVAQMNASKDMNQSFAENEIKQYQILHDAAHEIGMQKDQQAHEQQLAAQQQAAAAQSQQSDQQADQQSQVMDQAHQQNMAQQAQQSESE